MSELCNDEILKRLYPNAKITYIYSLSGKEGDEFVTGTAENMKEIDELVEQLTEDGDTGNLFDDTCDGERQVFIEELDYRIVLKAYKN
jgi:hypothetical protein